MNVSHDADVLVVGSGHNALVAAGYLATAGKRVVVLERNEFLGGGVASGELTEPGFVSDRHALFHLRILANPLIVRDELGLRSRYGLDYVPLDTPYSAIFTDGTQVPVGRDRAATASRIAESSPRDAQAYGRFSERAMEMVEAMTPGLFVPPPADPAAQAAALGSSPLGRHILRVPPRAVHAPGGGVGGGGRRRPDVRRPRARPSVLRRRVSAVRPRPPSGAASRARRARSASA